MRKLAAISARMVLTVLLFSTVLRIAAAIVLIGVAIHPVRAQQPGPQPAPPRADPPGWEFLFTPDLWIPWTSTSVDPKNSALRSRSSTVDPGKLISHLSWVPFMGQAEVRNGPYGLFLDYIHAPVKAGINTPGIIFGAATGGLVLDAGTAIVMYRPFSEPDQYVDVGVGARAWGFAGDISLNEGLLPAVSVTRGESWADALAAARYHRDLGNGFGATLYGDVGAGGAAVDWQVLATVDYSFRPRIDLHAGFRSMNFNYTGPLARFNVHMYGPILSGTLNF